MYQIVRTEDNAVVEVDLSLEEAQTKIIFYDTPDSPHTIKPQKDE